MAGSAAAEGILFIAALLVAAAFVGVLGGVVSDFSGGMRERGDRLSDQLRADITIINDPEEVPVSPSLVIYVKNTGASELTTVDMSVLVDGQASSSFTVDVLQQTDDETWPPGATIQITVEDLSIANGDHRLRVVSSSGASDTLEVRV